jgi:hypothetical protein
MGELTFVAVDGQRLARMREQGADEFGNPWVSRVAEGWEPLRCCLRRAGTGEAIALICYSPWVTASPWMEAGPVFVHFAECDGYLDPQRYPEDFRRSPSMINPFGTDGARVYQHITFVSPDDDHEEAVRLVMSQPEVDFLHVRSSTAGCFTFAVTSRGDQGAG